MDAVQVSDSGVNVIFRAAKDDHTLSSLHLSVPEASQVGQDADMEFWRRFLVGMLHLVPSMALASAVNVLAESLDVRKQVRGVLDARSRVYETLQREPDLCAESTASGPPVWVVSEKSTADSKVPFPKN